MVQFAPIALLDVGSYARFAAIYIAYAAAYSVILALLSDVWGRSLRTDTAEAYPSAVANIGSDKTAYYTVLTQLSLAGGFVVGVGTGAALGWGAVAFIAGLAAAFALYRAGSRYYQINTGGHLRAAVADMAAALISGATLVAIHSTGALNATGALTVWLAGSLVAVIVVREFHYSRTVGLRSWLRTHGHTARGLLAESVLMTASSAGTPYIVAAAAGLPAMAAIRAATSLLYPIRLILGVARSRIVAGSFGRTRGTMLGVAALSACCGLGLMFAVSGIGRLDFADTTLHLLGQNPASLGLLAAATFASTYLQFLARGILRGRALVVRRTFHTVAVVVSTAVGAAMHGVEGALLGSAVGTLITVVVWAIKLRDFRTSPNMSTATIRKDASR
ncbi:hypothetical protein [Georgenia faecalis]|uniref:hypothetical protein n=1 Tax=Georgenia faecalis TaxID=2483799 RepID=UPI000FDCB8F7|nr:hypothetical protein [Georgenia faecalis]